MNFFLSENALLDKRTFVDEDDEIDDAFKCLYPVDVTIEREEAGNILEQKGTLNELVVSRSIFSWKLIIPLFQG